ncbi:MAG: hypothetical protein WA687_11560 [Solirubrobacterales bacterium]
MGAVLLSVEAVTLENIRKLRDGMDTFVQRWWADLHNLRDGLRDSVLSVLIAMAGAGAFTLFVYLAWPTAGRLLVPILLLPIALGTLGFVIALGFVLPIYLIALMGAALVGVLDFIERNTPNGTIGIAGMALLVAGFAFQVLGA